jgi:hypothetical protein
MSSTHIAAGLLALATLPALAATQTIAVQPQGDVVHYRYWGGGFAERGNIVEANPNQVSHDYSWGSGATYDTTLSFDLSSASGIDWKDLQSATLNLNILAIWSNGPDHVANIQGISDVSLAAGTGWQSYDVTQHLAQALHLGAATADFTISYTGYSGFTFGSAEGGQPAFLSLNTTAVPEPGNIALALAGLSVVGWLGKRCKA